LPAAGARRSGGAIVADEAERFREWQASLDVVPAIASLRARAEEIRERSSSVRSSAARSGVRPSR
jgi:glutamyl-tRNA reductase